MQVVQGRGCARQRGRGGDRRAPAPNGSAQHPEACSSDNPCAEQRWDATIVAHQVKSTQDERGQVKGTLRADCICTAALQCSFQPFFNA